MPESDATKNILRMFSYGLFVATSPAPDGPRAATVSWVTQVSFEPKLIAVAMRKGTAICEAVQSSRRFALHVVGAHQPDLARAFFKVNQVGTGEIAGHRYRLSERGLPILDEALAWLECEVAEEANQGGDHALFIARILASNLQDAGGAPLELRNTVWHYGG